MAINYAEKHSAMIDERFKAASVLTGITNSDSVFVGVKTMHVHSVPKVAMNNYSLTGSNRYGTPTELQDQELTLTNDRAFMFTADKGNSEDDAALNAGKALFRQIDEVIVHEKDKYVLSVKSLVFSPLPHHCASSRFSNTQPFQKVMSLFFDLVPFALHPHRLHA